MPNIGVVDLPKRQRSNAFRFTDEELKQTLEALSQAKTGQAVTVTDPVKVSDYKPKDGKNGRLSAEQVARNVVTGRNNTILKTITPRVDDGFYAKMHVIPTDNGKSFVGAVSLRKGEKPKRKTKAKTNGNQPSNES